jgi:NhaP-type Na+/H+ and K+/H+ antiporter
MTVPSRRDALRPVEYIGIAAVVSIFVGLVVLGSTREIPLSLIFFGVAFIVTLVTLAMLALAMRPDADEKLDLDSQDHDAH